MKLISFLIILPIILINAKELPNTFHKCKRNDPNLGKCLIEAVNNALPQMKEGLAEFGILKLDPLQVNSLTIDQGANSPITLRQDFKNIELHKMFESKVTKYWPDLNNYTLRCEVFTPVTEFIADYVMDGRILLLPITGKGKANITMIGLKSVHELIGEPIKKKNEVYMRLKEYKIKFDPKRVNFYFENLFNGDETLGNAMNTFLNENWNIVFSELKGGYEDTFGYIFKETTNKLFTKIPMNKIFLLE